MVLPPHSLVRSIEVDFVSKIHIAFCSLRRYIPSTQQPIPIMNHSSRLLVVYLVAGFILIGSSSAASTYKRQAGTTSPHVTVSAPPAADQHPSPTSTPYQTFSIREPLSRFKRSHQSDISVSSAGDAPPSSQQNDTIFTGAANSCAAHLPSCGRTWMPTVGTILNSVVHVIIMILGVLNINININRRAPGICMRSSHERHTF